LTQVPPSGRPVFTNAVRAPRSLALITAPKPPAPAPIATRSKCSMVLGDKEVLAGLTSLLLCRVSIDFSLESRLFCYLDAVARLVRRLHRRSDAGLRTGSLHGVARGRYCRRQGDEAIRSVVVRPRLLNDHRFWSSRTLVGGSRLSVRDPSGSHSHRRCSPNCCREK